MKCNQCGSICPDNAKFCANCGNKLIKADPIPVVEAKPFYTDKKDNKQEQSRPEKASGGKKLPFLFWLSGGLLIHGLIFFTYCLMCFFVYDSATYSDYNGAYLFTKYSDVLGLLSGYSQNSYYGSVTVALLITLFAVLAPCAIAIFLTLRRYKKK